MSGLPEVVGLKTAEEARELRELRVEVERLRADQRDWRKGVELIASGLGEQNPRDLCCSRLSEVALTLRARLEEAESEMGRLNNIAVERGDRLTKLGDQLKVAERERDALRDKLADRMGRRPGSVRLD